MGCDVSLPARRAGGTPASRPLAGPAAACGLRSPWLQTPSRRRGLRVWKRTREFLLRQRQTLSGGRRGHLEVCQGLPILWALICTRQLVEAVGFNPPTWPGRDYYAHLEDEEEEA